MGGTINGLDGLAMAAGLRVRQIWLAWRKSFVAFLSALIWVVVSVGSSSGAWHCAAALWLLSSWEPAMLSPLCSWMLLLLGPSMQPFLAFGQGQRHMFIQVQQGLCRKVGLPGLLLRHVLLVSNLLDLDCSCVSSLLSGFVWSKKFQFEAPFSRSRSANNALLFSW